MNKAVVNKTSEMVAITKCFIVFGFWRVSLYVIEWAERKETTLKSFYKFGFASAIDASIMAFDLHRFSTA